MTIEEQRDAAVHLLQQWLDWCFDESGTYARPDKWTKEFLENRPRTGGDVNDAPAVARRRIYTDQEEMREFRASMAYIAGWVGEEYPSGGVVSKTILAVFDGEDAKAYVDRQGWIEQ